METTVIVTDLIDSIIAGESAFAQEKFEEVLAAKLSDSIGAAKQELAQSFYGSTDA